MKKCRVILSILLCVAVMLGCTASVGASMALPLRIGDMDRDYAVTILDVTRIQRFLAKMAEASELDEALGDVDRDGEMSAADVTVIQRSLAGMSGAAEFGEIDDYFIGDISFHSSCEIMQAGFYMTGQEQYYVGVPVTFVVRERWGAMPRKYTLSVNGEVVRQIDADGFDAGVMTYTFEEEGTYQISTAIECKYGVSTQNTREVQVVSLPEDGTPVVMGAVFYGASRMSSGDGVMTVHAAGGTGEYRYRYEILSNEVYDIPETDGSGEITPTVSSVLYDSGFIADSTINLTEIAAKYSFDPHDPVIRVRITVRDSDGKISQPVTAGYIAYEVLA